MVDDETGATIFSNEPYVDVHTLVNENKESLIEPATIEIDEQ